MTRLVFTRIVEGLSAAADAMDAAVEGLARDYSSATASAICRAGGEHTIAQGTQSHPLLAATLPFAAQGLSRAGVRIPAGGIFIGNDPYEGGASVSDLRVFSSVAVGPGILFTVGNAVRYHDLGGRSPGGFCPGATEVHQEGVRIPWTGLYAGELDRTIVALLSANARFPDRFATLLGAQVAGLKAGVTRISVLVARYGAEAVLEAEAELSRRAREAMAAGISDLPDGAYAFEDLLDGDGLREGGLRLCVTARVSDNRLSLDFSGSDGPSLGPMNCPAGLAEAACRVAIRNLFPEAGSHTAAYDPVTISIPEGSFLQARFPRPVSGSVAIAGRIVEAVTAALAEADPARAGAGGFGSACHLSLHGSAEGVGEYLATLSLGGGLGACIRGDGLTNASGTASPGGMPDVEWLEERYPVRVLEYAVRPGSGGAGRYRGGMGVTFSFEVLRGRAVLTVFGDRTLRGAEGLRRGTRGARARVEIIQGERRKGQGARVPFRLSPFGFPLEESECSSLKVEGIVLEAGDRVRVDTPGGGGYGHPYERAIRLVARDVENGFLSRREAAVQHGVIFYQNSLDYDSSRTFRLRSYPLTVADIEGILDDVGGPVKE